jgi:hypothetical protein
LNFIFRVYYQSTAAQYPLSKSHRSHRKTEDIEPREVKNLTTAQLRAKVEMLEKEVEHRKDLLREHHIDAFLTLKLMAVIVHKSASDDESAKFEVGVNLWCDALATLMIQRNFRGGIPDDYTRYRKSITAQKSKVEVPAKTFMKSHPSVFGPEEEKAANTLAESLAPTMEELHDHLKVEARSGR